MSNVDNFDKHILLNQLAHLPLEQLHDPLGKVIVNNMIKIVESLSPTSIKNLSVIRAELGSVAYDIHQFSIRRENIMRELDLIHEKVHALQMKQSEEFEQVEVPDQSTH